MPKIVRWFRVTHDINQDPEMWELRTQFGDRAGFVWLECLSIADRNEGLVGPNSPQLHAVLASKCRVYSPKVRAILGWLLGAGWLIQDDSIAHEVGTNSPPIAHEHATNMERTTPIRTKFVPSSYDVGEYLRVAKWAKYNASRKSIDSPPRLDFLDSPSETPKIKNQEPATPEPSAEPANAGKKELDPRIKKAADKVYLTDPVKFRRLIVWIKECEKYNYMPAVIAAALERFLPYAADITDWYPYLDKIIVKAEKDLNIAQHDAEHAKLKEETREASKKVTHIGDWVKDA